MSAPGKIRVALIGLNAPPPGTPSGTNWAASGHLPYLLSSDKYELVALQNSSAARATEAIKAYGLDASTKAYGTPEGNFSCNSMLRHVTCAKMSRGRRRPGRRSCRELHPRRSPCRVPSTIDQSGQRRFYRMADGG
jgi:hypothetical protein